MMIVYKHDRTYVWCCDRCGRKSGRRVMLKAQQRDGVNPPWGWAGDATATLCEHCKNQIQSDASACS